MACCQGRFPSSLSTCHFQRKTSNEEQQACSTHVSFTRWISHQPQNQSIVNAPVCDPRSEQRGTSLHTGVRSTEETMGALQCVLSVMNKLFMRKFRKVKTKVFAPQSGWLRPEPPLQSSIRVKSMHEMRSQSNIKNDDVTSSSQFGS